MTPADREKRRVRIERARQEADAERKREFAEASKRAGAIWSKAVPGGADHPYLVRKKVKLTPTLREMPAETIKSMLGYEPAAKGELLIGRLLIAPIVIDGKITGVEMIDESGRKAFLKGGAVSGGYWATAKLPEGDGEDVTLLVGEGVATVLSAAEATGYVGVAALSAGNLAVVAKAMRARFPKARLVMLADLDASGVGLAKATEAAQAAGGFVAVPDFGANRPDGAKDFNDMAALCGLKAVCTAIEAAREPEPEVTPRETQVPAPSNGEPVAVDDDAEIARLAKLSPIECDRQLKPTAERLGCRVSTLAAAVKAKRGEAEGAVGQGRPLELPEPDPWPDEVVGASLLDEMAATICHHVVMAEGLAEAVALWTVATHALDAFAIYPRLVLASPVKQCGKTTLLDVISHLVPKPLFIGHTTASPLFRAIELVRPTLLLDEADSFLTDNEELRGLINLGHRRDGAVMRSVGEDFKPHLFSVWAPLAIAAIGRVQETIEDRSIIIPLRRRRLDEPIENFSAIDPVVIDPLKRLARQAARWAADHTESLRKARPKRPAGVYNRAADNWHPLLAVADAAGGRWPELARRIAETMVAAAADDDASIRVVLLGDIRDVFAEKKLDRLASAELARALEPIEGRPWGEWKNGKPLSSHALARLLKPFGIAPARIDNQTRGWRRDQFDEAFARYLPPAATVKVSQMAGFRASQRDEQTSLEFGGDGCEEPANPQDRAICDGLTVGKGGYGENAEEDGTWTD
jgi:putative DNA primase/helicase